MKCNLPEGFKATVSEEAGFDAPNQYKIKSMPQIDRRNMPIGYNQRPKMAYGTGKNYNFANQARSRRNEQTGRRNNAVNDSRISESSRVFNRMAGKYNSYESEM
jgi:hypothetical protein